MEKYGNVLESDPFLMLNGEDDGELDEKDKENVGADAVPLLVRLTESVFSGPMFERKAAARQIQDAFAQAYFMEEPISNIMTVIERLVEDDEQAVRAEITDQLPKVAVFCHEIGSQLNFVVPQHILPLLVRLLTDEFAQVRKLSQTGILLLLERDILTPSQIQEHIYPIIIQFTQPPANDENRTEITAFMGKLALMIGMETTVNFYLERFCHLCGDSLLQVRRVCAASMGDFANVVGTALTQEILLPKFLLLCEDDVWGVRKGCAEVFTSVSSMCQLITRKETLSPAFIKLLEDPSRWVRVSAYESLGSLIASYSCNEDEERTKSTKLDRTPLEEAFIQRLKANGEQAQLEIRFQKMVEDCISKSEESSKITEKENSEINSTSTNHGFGDTTELKNMGNGTTGIVCKKSEFAKDLAFKKISWHEPEPLNSNNDSGESKCWFGGDCLPSNSELSHSPDILSSHNEEEFGSNDAFEDPEKSFFESDLGYEDINCDFNVEEFPKCDELIVTVNINEDNSIDAEPAVEKQIPTSSQENISLTMSDSNSFNTWQYWRLPVINFDLLEVELDLGNVNFSSGGNAATHKPDVQDSNVDSIPSISVSDYDSSIKYCTLDSKERGEVTDNTSDDDAFFEKRTRERKGSGGFTSRGRNKSKEPAEVLVNDSWEGFDGSWNTETGQSDSDALAKFKAVDVNTSPFSEETPPGSEEKFETMLSEIYEHAPACTSPSAFEDSSSHVADVHRSYMNLFHPNGEDSGAQRYDQDYYNEMSSLFEPEELPYILKAHGPKGKSRLLPNIPESTSLTDQDIVPEPLLKHFVEMCSPLCDHSLESELANVCVFSLPAVVYTLGPENWSLVRNCFENLALRYQWKIRYTLAASLHEIATVLGPAISGRDLVPFFAAMTKDLDEVRIGVLRNLASFVKVLNSNDRKLCLDSLQGFLSTDNKRNWRFRVELSDQVAHLVDLYEIEDVVKHLCPIAYELILDSVAAVRQSAVDLICILVNRLRIEPSFENNFLSQLIHLLCRSQRWVHRQIFATLAANLLRSEALSPIQFAQHILPHLIGLSDDPIPNVRIVVAQTLSSEVLRWMYFSDSCSPHNDIIMSTISMLQCDADRDVQYFSGNCHQNTDTLEKESEIDKVIEPS